MEDIVATTFERVFGSRVAELRDAADTEFAQAVFAASRAGMIHSGRSVVQMMEVEKSLTTRVATAALNEAMRTLTAAGTLVTSSNMFAVDELLERAISREEKWLRERMRSMPPFISKPDLVPANKVDDTLDRHLAAQVDSVKSEVALTALRNDHTPPEAIAERGMMVFNAPVGQVIAGQGNTGFSEQVVSTNDTEPLVAALEAVIGTLTSSPKVDERRELVEIAEEAKKELSKEKPNRSKLTALLGMLDKALTLVPKTEQALESLRKGAEAIGIPLW